MFYNFSNKGAQPPLDAGFRCGSSSSRLISCLQACLQSPLPDNCVTRLGRTQPIRAQQQLLFRACIKLSTAGCQTHLLIQRHQEHRKTGREREREREKRERVRARGRARNFLNPCGVELRERLFYYCIHSVSINWTFVLDHLSLWTDSDYSNNAFGTLFCACETSACSSLLTETFVANPKKKKNNSVFL